MYVTLYLRVCIFTLCVPVVYRDLTVEKVFSLLHNFEKKVFLMYNLLGTNLIVFTFLSNCFIDFFNVVKSLINW